MPDNIYTAAANAGGQLLGGLFGLLTEGHEDQRQREQQQALTDIQVKAQKDMSFYNLNLQKDMWNYTNYENQLKHLQNAGLNPALLYGKGGGGGATATISPGSVSGGTAAGHTGELQQAQLMGMQLANTIALQKAQVENIESQTNLNNVEAKKKEGIETDVLTAQLDNIKANTDSTAANTALTKLKSIGQDINNTIQAATSLDQIRITDLQAQLMQEQEQIIQNDKEISNAVKNFKIEQSRLNLAQMYLQNSLIKANINLTNTQAYNIVKQLSISQAYLNNDTLVKTMQAAGQQIDFKDKQSQIEYRKIMGNVAQYRLFFQGLGDIMGGLGEGLGKGIKYSK